MCGGYHPGTHIFKVYGYIKYIVCVHNLYVNVVIHIFLHNILNCEELYHTINLRGVKRPKLGAFTLLT